jgi:hypothetical protein
MMEKEKRIGLISNLRVGCNDRSKEIAIAFDVRFGERLCTSLRVVGPDAVQAIIDFGAEDLAHSAKACFIVSLEEDGSFCASGLTGFAGFVK